MLCYHCVDRTRKLEKLINSEPRKRFGGISLCNKCYTNACIRDDALRPAIHTDLCCDACYRRRQEQWVASLERDPSIYEEVAMQNNKWKTTGQKDCLMRFLTADCQNYMNAQEQKEWEADIVSRLTFV